MYVKRLEIENLRCVRSLKIDLGPLSVFIGPNGAGKSTILDALGFVSDFLFVRDPIGVRGGFRDLVWNFDTKRPVSISLQVKGVPFEARSLEFRYDLVLSFDSARGAAQIELDELRAGPKVLWQSHRGKLRVWDARDRRYMHDDIESFRPASTYVRPSKSRFAMQCAFVEAWGNFVSSTLLVPQSMRRMDVPQAGDRLEKSGANVAARLQELLAESPERRRRILEDVRRLLPEAEDLATPPSNGKVFLTLREAGLKAPVPAWSLSEGTLRVLGLVTQLHDMPRGSVLLIDEPEASLHVRAVRQLTNLLLRSTEEFDHQILIATHSPFLADGVVDFKHLFVVWKESGATRCKAIGDRTRLADGLRELGLVEAMQSGALDPW